MPKQIAAPDTILVITDDEPLTEDASKAENHWHQNLSSFLKTLKRRKLLKLALLTVSGMGLTVMARNVSFFDNKLFPFSREPSPPKLPSVPPGKLGPSNFKVVTVNAKGEKFKQEKGQAQYFTEDLGNDVNLEMVVIRSGKFLMGAPKTEKDSDDKERPQHTVKINHFFMGRFLVTQAQWRAIANLPSVEIPLKFNPSSFKGDNLPVETVSWYDAVEFCKRLSIKTGRDYRLPSEAEWEYACRAGTNGPFHLGDTITSDFANYDATNTYKNEPKGKRRGETTPVGNFNPNAFGLYDMHGNVWEWCADNWNYDYQGAPTDFSARTTGGKNNHSPLRGGSWYVEPEECRSANRIHFNRNVDNEFVGFRVVCSYFRT